MDQSSDYKYFRYLMALNYATGHFTADHVFSPNLEDIRFRIVRIPVFMYIILSINSTWMALNFILYDFKGQFLGTAHHSLFFWMDMAFTSWNLFVGSKSVIEVFKILDASRKRQAVIPGVLRASQSSPAVYAYAMTFLFLITHIVFPIAFTYYSDLNLTWNCVFYFAHFSCFPYRMCLVFSSIFYLSSLIVQDTARAWSRYCERYHQSFYHIEVFCQMLQEQRDMVDKINFHLGTPILILLVYRCTTVASNLLYNTH
ncbi:hypothetical protein J6590_086769 [Homalodisca vitripennis]|nr:hypothetical protein J6590_086769 [Homalodisca vitripennis]